MDWGIAINRLRPDAKYTRYSTYQELVETWTDETILPTEKELKTAYAEWEAEQQASVVTERAVWETAKNAVGVHIDQLTLNQIKALLAVQWYQLGIIDHNGLIKPLNDWRT